MVGCSWPRGSSCTKLTCWNPHQSRLYFDKQTPGPYLTVCWFLWRKNLTSLRPFALLKALEAIRGVAVRIKTSPQTAGTRTPWPHNASHFQSALYILTKSDKVWRTKNTSSPSWDFLIQNSHFFSPYGSILPFLIKTVKKRHVQQRHVYQHPSKLQKGWRRNSKGHTSLARSLSEAKAKQKKNAKEKCKSFAKEVMT